MIIILIDTAMAISYTFASRKVFSMSKTSTRLLVFLLALYWLVPSSAWAYSYGNANTEDIAVAFTDINAKLNADPADWTGAKAAYEERKSEMASHFGEQVPKELDAAFAAQDKERVIADMQGVLVLNIERRFKYAIEGFSDYNQTKLLLAKARATYETLKPYMAGKLSDQDLQSLDAQFETALDALGNPGLFGVGKKEANQPLFESTLKAIDDKIHPLFPFEGGTITGDGSEETGASPSASAGADHAPMEETDKTNPAVTIGVLAGVVIVGGAVVWLVRRRK
jgi:hypothetical protein